MATAKVDPTGEVHALFVVDPGGTTGVTAGHFELHRMLRETLTKGRIMLAHREVRGGWHEQGMELADLINRFMFVAQCERGVPVDQCHLVFENYTRRPTAHDNDLQPVWVAASAFSILGRPELDTAWQEPSDAKGFATNERLRMWDLWYRGSVHIRDANRHLALRLNRLLL